MKEQKNNYIAQVLDISVDPETYKKNLEQLDPLVMKKWIDSGARTPFISLLDHDDEKAILKMKATFKNAKRLHIDPNAQFNSMNLGLSEVMVWNNTALHLWLANERFSLILPFLQFAKEYELEIDLNKKDREGKTPLMLAIKMGNVPIEIISALINNENYNTPDDTGVTPLMMACAMRRVDIAKLIIEKEASQLGLEPLDFENLTEEQKNKLSSFINQQHPETGKTLGHYGILRLGTPKDLSEPNSYQQTVTNILKSVCIDSRRDENARSNAPTNDTGAQIVMSREEINFFNQMKSSGSLEYINLEALGLKQGGNQTDMVFTQLSYRREKICENALLASLKNAFLMISKTLGEDGHLYKNVRQQLDHYSGISYGESIMRRTHEMIQFLYNIGLDFSLKQKLGNKTVADYLQTLKKPGNKGAVTREDMEYIFPILDQLKGWNQTTDTTKQLSTMEIKNL